MNLNEVFTNTIRYSKPAPTKIRNYNRVKLPKVVNSQKWFQITDIKVEKKQKKLLQKLKRVEKVTPTKKKKKKQENRKKINFQKLN